MKYPVNTPVQLKAVLRALRKSRKLSQADLGKNLGVNQKRVARIETAPGVTSFDQISRIVAALGARIVIEENAGDVGASQATAHKAPMSDTCSSRTQENW